MLTAATTRVLLPGLLLLTLVLDAAQADLLTLQPGQHVAIIGNTLADRMQHSGWLETLLQARFPQHELVVRDLGFSGDTLTERPRSDNFGTPDEWLTRVRADVVLAFFGYNESFAGEDGLPRFRSDLQAFITHTRGQKYNSHSPPILVLFSPIAHLDLHNRHLPNGRENNARVALYTSAMEDVARQEDVPFVNLFAATQMWGANSDNTEHPRLPVRTPATTQDAHGGNPEAAITHLTSSLSLNGIHLTDAGYQKLAVVIDAALFGVRQPPEPERLNAIRSAVLDKNRHWHNVYRATDGYSVFGGRSSLRFVDGQTNFDVMQRELQILEAMVANRDRVIRAAAEGQSLAPDDRHLPEPLQVTTNKPGPLEDGQHRFLGGDEAIGRMTIHAGMEVNLFASEEQFPELVNPVQSAVDPDGRLWVAAWPTYPHWNPLRPMNDRLLILPDDDGDGRADRGITFADQLHNPTGFEFWNGGVLVAMAPDIFFLKDTDGDDICDLRERVFHGLDSADTHHTANTFVMGPNGRFCFSRGIFHAENFENPWGPAFRAGTGDAGVYEFDPLRFDIRLQFPIGPNPHGDVFDQWGRQFATDATGGTGHYVAFPGRGAPRPLYTRRVRPVPAIAILDSTHFPEAHRGNLLIANVIGFQGVTQYRFESDGAGITAREVEPIVYSSDPNFRPSDLEIGGDGALYILDWQNPLIGHMQHNLRDPSRDHSHGRVYRVTATGRPLMPVARLKGRPVADVLQQLASPTLSERCRARLELTGRDSADVVSALAAWTETFDPTRAESALKLTEALWIHQQHRIPNIRLLTQVLQSPQPEARAAGLRVLREWYGAEDIRRRNPAGWESTNELNPDEWLIRLAADENVQVRAEAVVAAALINGTMAAEVLFTAMQSATDEQLDFNLQEALQMIDAAGYIRRQLADGRQLSPAAHAWALLHADVSDLMTMEPSESIYRAVLTREQAPLETLQKALAGLTELTSEPPLELLLTLIDELNEQARVGSVASLSRLLSSQPAADLIHVRDRIAALALSGSSAEARRAAWAAWMTADGGGEAAFAAAGKDPDRLRDLLDAIPLISTPVARAVVYTSLRPLLFELPGTSGSGAEPGSGEPTLQELAIRALSSIPGHDAERAADLMVLIRAQKSTSSALQALSQIASAAWPAEQLGSLSDGIVHVLTETPPPRRNQPEAGIIFELANTLAARLPAANATRFRQNVDALRVPLIEIGTVPERMIYDREILAVQAGRPVEFRLRNTDNMPHNFAVVLPGALEAVGQLAEATGRDPDAIERQYIPASDAILVASRLLQPGQTESVFFDVPSRPGIYPYVCTWPGHWRRMYGALYVVEDLEKYHDDPIAYVADSRLVMQDPLLRYLGRNTEWTLDDLQGDVMHLHHRASSFVVGQQVFRTTGCTGCHKLGGTGTNVGPDLTRLPAEYAPLDVLDHILAPSKRVDQKFRSSVVALKSGKVLTGLIIEESPTSLRILDSPAEPDKPTTVALSDIEERQASSVSIMPKGVLNRLNREEILDLLAYVISGGNQQHKLFEAHDHPH